MLTKKIPATSAGTKLQNKEKPAVRELLTAGMVDLEGLRTLDLSDANRTLSQLSYRPECSGQHNSIPEVPKM